MITKNQFAAGAVLALCSTGAFADPFTFDPTGTAGPSGNISNVGLFDQSPGNSLAINGGGVLTAGTAITVLYQANLSTAQDGNGANVYSNGGNGRYFTFTAGFGERISGVTADGNGLNFQFDPTNTTNFFRVYSNTVGLGNNLAGTGFTNGTLIMSGVFSASGFASNYSRSANTTTQNFDQSSNGDQYSGFQSIVGSGSTRLTAVISFIDSNYFPDLTAGSTFSFFNTSQVTPFNQVDPSRSFTAMDGSTRTPNLGTQNGGNSAANGPDFQLQADANQSFTRVVPEPDSLLLMGLGLGLVGFLTKRRKQVA